MQEAVSAEHFQGLWLSKKPCRNVAHILLLQLVVFTSVSVYADVLESIDNALDVKAHLCEAADQVGVESSISMKSC